MKAMFDRTLQVEMKLDTNDDGRSATAVYSVDMKAGQDAKEVAESFAKFFGGTVVDFWFL